MDRIGFYRALLVVLHLTHQVDAITLQSQFGLTVDSCFLTGIVLPLG